jgi:hypothetical protein
MSLWIAIPLGVGIIMALTAVIRRRRRKRFYANGIVQSCIAVETDHDCLQVRTYVDPILAQELEAPSKLIGRMFIRGTNAIVPLTFVRVPYVAPRVELADKWQEHAAGCVLPVVFRFDPPPNLVVRPGQLVDVYIGSR